MTGSVAAFKAATLASEMVQAGMEVRVVMTDGGSRFVSPLTFEALTGHPVAQQVWDDLPGSSRMGHLDLARWADIVVVAPASANTLARLALGLAGDVLGTLALATRAHLLLVPAMESAMFEHPITQEHVKSLRARGATILGPESGRLASGTTGTGRMSEPGAVLQATLLLLETRRSLSGVGVLITAGPTYESIDRVRFLGNRSSGKMGYAIARAAAARGAHVHLVSGPTHLDFPPGVRVTSVVSTQEMYDAVMSSVTTADVVVMSAAVADFRPSDPVDGKLKRAETLRLDLVATPDIAAAASAAAPHALHVGFALESEDLVLSARRKLARKGQHLVIANVISPEHNPFGSDSNQVTFVTHDGETTLPEMTKAEIATRLCDEIARLLQLSGDQNSSSQ